MRPGQAFAAIKGSRADGHAFAAAAARAGAAFLILQREVEVPEGTPVVLVPDTTIALRDLAAWLRSRDDLEVVGVTGSAGKTTTKALTAAALNAWASPGNYNTVYGLALALAEMPEGTRTAVLEMGISAPGEMADLTAIARPDAVVLLNVAPAHTEFFSGLAALAAEKASVLAGLRPGGGAVWNADDPLLEAAVLRALPDGAKTLRFGAGEGAEVRLESWEPRGLQGGKLVARLPEGERIAVHLGVPGRHNALNALAALAVGLLLGRDVGAMAEALAAATPLEGRGRVLSLGPVTVLDESYNANPRSVEAALRTLREGAEGRRTVAVLGDMLELGRESGRHHRDVGLVAAREGISVLIGVGEAMEAGVAAAREAGLAAAVHVPDAARAGRWLAEHWQPGDLVLVKGSRRIGTEAVIDALSRAVEGRSPQPSGCGNTAGAGR